MELASTPWPILEKESLEKGDLDALFAGRVSCIRISNFLEPSWCREVAERFLALPSPPARLVDYDGANIRRVGAVLSENLADQEAYFAGTAALDRVIRGLYKGGEDPLLKLRRDLGKAAGWEAIALEEGGRPYLTDLVWQLLAKARVPLHCDATPGWFQETTNKRSLNQKAMSLRIFDFPRLLNWNVYFDVPESGGALRIYDRRGGQGERVKMGDKARSSDALVAGARRAHLQPSVGDLVLFDVNRYHEVTEIVGDGRRISCHSQVGINEKAKEMVFWI